MIEEGSLVSGVDLKGVNIDAGTVQNILKVFGVAIVKTGEDRIQITEAYLENLEVILIK